jgi:hypothetical protein
MWWLGLVTIVVTGVGSIAALGSWLGVGSGVSKESGATPGVTSPGAQPTAGGGQANNTVALTDLPIQAGASNLTQLPKALRDSPAYAGSLAISCPTNQSTDKHREVTYLLRGRYSDFTVQIQSSFPNNPALRASLTALGGFKESDGTITRRELGTGLATAGQWSTLSADVERAEELTLRARCDEPGGVVIISAAAAFAQ